MEKTIIRVGDANSSGGKVISGSTDHTILGKGIARMGDHEFGQQFKLVDHVNGRPLQSRSYRIFCNGFATEGVTDADGLTAKVFESKPTTATVYVEEVSHPPINPRRHHPCLSAWMTRRD